MDGGDDRPLPGDALEFKGDSGPSRDDIVSSPSTRTARLPADGCLASGLGAEAPLLVPPLTAAEGERSVGPPDEAIVGLLALAVRGTPAPVSLLLPSEDISDRRERETGRAPTGGGPALPVTRFAGALLGEAPTSMSNASPMV
jgi:hypothetical protein